MSPISTDESLAANALDLMEVRRKLRERMSEKRYRHVENVIEYAKEMASRWGEDPKKAEIAALFHDYAKDKRLADNDVLHGSLAADAIRGEYGIEDEDILNAVRYHTTGRRGMSRLELIVFLADTLEPARDYPGVEALRAITERDLYRGALAVFRDLKTYLYANSLRPVQDTIEAVAWLEEMELDELEGER
jgi:HD superfamily phosphohydrolase YqeK